MSIEQPKKNRATIKMNPANLPQLPVYLRNSRYTTQIFKPTKSSDDIQVSSDNINQILMELKYLRVESVRQISDFMTDLAKKTNITLHLLLKENIYYLIIKNNQSSKAIAIKALKVTQFHKISSIYDQSSGVCIQIIDTNKTDNPVNFDDKQMSVIKYQQFKNCIKQFIENGTIDASLLTYDINIGYNSHKKIRPSKSKSKPKETKPKETKPQRTKPQRTKPQRTKPQRTKSTEKTSKKDQVALNAAFVQRLFNEIFPNQSLSTDEISNLTESSKSYDFQQCYGKSIVEIQAVLHKPNVTADNVLLEANKVFFCFIITKKMSTIQFLHKKPQFQQLITETCDSNYNDLLRVYIQNPALVHNHVQLLIQKRNRNAAMIFAITKEGTLPLSSRNTGGVSLDD